MNAVYAKKDLNQSWADIQPKRTRKGDMRQIEEILYI